MDKQDVVYTSNRMLYSALKRKEILTSATTWMNLEDIMLSEINQSQNKYCMRIGKRRETESRRVVDRGWKEREMGSCLMGIEFQFCKTKRVLEISCTTM